MKEVVRKVKRYTLGYIDNHGNVHALSIINEFSLSFAQFKDANLVGTKSKEKMLQLKALFEHHEDEFLYVTDLNRSISQTNIDVAKQFSIQVFEIDIEETLKNVE